MKTHQLFTNEAASPFAFEVERIYLPPAMAVRLLADVDGVSDVERKNWQRTRSRLLREAEPEPPQVKSLSVIDHG
jgi:hypothetical protein